MRSRTLKLAALLATLGLLVASCASDLPQSSLNPKADEAQSIDQLWILVLTAATIVFVLVMVAFVIALIRFRARPDSPEPKQSHGNTRLEITWTIIPAVVLAVIAVPTVRTLFDLRAEPENPAVVVNVTGHQWWWEFEYPDFVTADGRTLKTANELHIPAGVTTQLVMTSADVIHSFWVPPLNGKRDVVPGKETSMKLTPDADVAGQIIPGQCAEYCWLAHADMRFNVHVQTQEDFDAWAAAQLEPAPVPAEGTEAAAGFETFSQICTTCHQAYVSGPDGVAEVGVAFGPDLTHFGSRTSLGANLVANTEDHLAQWIDNPSSIKPMAPELNDLANGRILGMPDYGLTQEQIAQLVELLKGWR